MSLSRVPVKLCQVLPLSLGIHISMQEDLHLRVRLRLAVFDLDLRAGELRKHDLRICLQEQPFQVLATVSTSEDSRWQILLAPTPRPASVATRLLDNLFERFGVLMSFLRKEGEREKK